MTFFWRLISYSMARSSAWKEFMFLTSTFFPQRPSEHFMETFASKRIMPFSRSTSEAPE